MNKGYEQANSLLDKLKKTETIVGLDMDDTIATEKDNPSPSQLARRKGIRTLLKAKGVVEMAQSMRTWELMLSSGAFEASSQIQQLRKVPNYAVVGTPQGFVQKYEPLEHFSRFESCFDWDAILVPGNGIAFKANDEYVVDWEWDHVLRHRWGPDSFNPKPWREAVMEFVLKLYPKIAMFLSPLEFEANYYEGHSDVLTLQYRIQLDFLGSDGFAQKEEFKRLLMTARDTCQVARRIKTIDESNPAMDRYTLYLVPWWGRKESLLNRFVQSMCKTAGVASSRLKLLLAGDTLTDLRAGLYGGGNAAVTFFLPENSRLTPYLAEWLKGDKSPAEWARAFAGEPLERLCSRLKPTNKKGEYLFDVSTRHKYPNKFVFGQQAYPGLVGAHGVHAFLQTELA